MRIFVTGATGFIGRALIMRLRGGGHEVCAWVRNESTARSLLGPELRLVGDAAGTPALAEEVARADAIVNLAGEPVLGGRWTAGRRRAISDSRISLTTAIVDAIEHASQRPAVLVSASAVGYYGDRGEELLDEQSPPGNDFLAKVCHAWEMAAMRAEEFGVRVFTPRIGIVLGADGGALAQMLPPFRFGAGGPIGSGRQWMPWIHLFDLVEIIATALVDSRYAGPAIAAAPLPVTNREFAQTLGRVLHRPSLIPVPGLALRALFGEGAEVLTSGQRVNPARLRELGLNWQFEKLEAALRHILNDDGPMIGPLRANSPQPENPHGSQYLQKRRPAYLLRHATRVAAPVSEVFSFFSRPQNLGVMTPADMHFQIKGDMPDANPARNDNRLFAADGSAAATLADTNRSMAAAAAIHRFAGTRSVPMLVARASFSTRRRCDVDGRPGFLRSAVRHGRQPGRPGVSNARAAYDIPLPGPGDATAVPRFTLSAYRCLSLRRL